MVTFAAKETSLNALHPATDISLRTQFRYTGSAVEPSGARQCDSLLQG